MLKTICNLCCVHTAMCKLLTVLMTVVYLQVSPHHSVIPAFFQVAALCKFVSTVFFLAMWEVAIQEAEPFSRTSNDILDDVKTKKQKQTKKPRNKQKKKVLKSIKQNCIDWIYIIKPLDGLSARCHIRIQALILRMWEY